MSDLVLLPYIKINDEWVFPDESIRGLYRQMVIDGVVDVFFHQNSHAEDKFVKYCQEPGTYMVVIVLDTGEPGGMVFLKDFGRNFAYGHFCMFKSIWGSKAVDAGKMAIDHFFSLRKPDGDALLDVLIGVIPSNNKRACEYISKIGMTEVGIIPKILFNKNTKEKVGAFYCYVERGKDNGR